MARIQLSPNFYLDEFTRSQTAARAGIEITVELGSDIHHNLIDLCERILQPLRDALGPVHISSGYRPHRVNALVGGSKSSSHLHGLAADITVTGCTPLEVARWLRNRTAGYDQIIHEFGQWVHASVAPESGHPRGECLTAIKVPRRLRKPKTVYVLGLKTVEDALLTYKGLIP